MPTADSFSTGALPRPRITWTGVGLAAVCWSLYALSYTFFVVRQSPDVPFVGVLIGQVVFAGLLAAASVPAWWITVRTMDDAHWGWTVAAHLVLAPLYAWGTLAAYIAVLDVLIGPVATDDIRANFQWILFGNLTIYAVQFAIYHLVRSVQRLRWREQQAAEYAALARERELAALKAQIHPHVLFNTLNSISATVPIAPEQAREMIADLAHLLRYALDTTNRDRVPLRDELDVARAYLDLEARRFSDRLCVQYDIEPDGDALDTRVPPMIVQPLVENAIKHGIAPRADGGTVTLHVARRNGHLRVSVADTGAGPDTDAPLDGSTGVGLSNTSERLIHAFGPDAALRTAAVDPHGFRVWFDIPHDPP